MDEVWKQVRALREALSDQGRTLSELTASHNALIVRNTILYEALVETARTVNVQGRLVHQLTLRVLELERIRKSEAATERFED